jgi:hypothetical protein
VDDGSAGGSSDAFNASLNTGTNSERGLEHLSRASSLLGVGRDEHGHALSSAGGAPWRRWLSSLRRPRRHCPSRQRRPRILSLPAVAADYSSCYRISARAKVRDTSLTGRQNATQMLPSRGIQPCGSAGAAQAFDLSVSLLTLIDNFLGLRFPERSKLTEVRQMARG